MNIAIHFQHLIKPQCPFFVLATDIKPVIGEKVTQIDGYGLGRTG